MKIVIVSDIHGDPLYPIKEEVKRTNPDLAIFLGDYDQTKTLDEIQEISKLVPTKILPGNHEEGLLTGKPFTSGSLFWQHKSFDQLQRELHSSPKHRLMVKKLLSDYKQEFEIPTSFGQNYRTLLLHGALDSNYTPKFEEDEVYTNLWRRLESPGDHAKNFNAMLREGYKIHLRGHDGEPEIASKPLRKNKGVEIKTPEKDVPYTLKPNRLYTITTGDYMKSHFTVINTNPTKRKYPTVEFKEVSYI